MNHFLLKTIAVLSLFTAAAASAGSIEDTDKGTVIHVKVFDLPDPGKTDTFTRAEAAAVKEFIKRYPKILADKYKERYKADPQKYGNHDWDNVSIELEQFSGISVPGVEVDLMAIAGGMAPDVIYVNFRKSDTYIQEKFLYPLDKPEDGYISGMSEEELKLRVHPRIWPVIKRKGPEGTVNTWALPYGGALGRVLLYRKDLFASKNIPFPTKEWTWDDMLDAAKKLTDPETGTYGISLTKSKHEAYYWIPFLWSAGGKIMEQNPDTGNWLCVFNSKEAAVALDYYTRLCTEKWTDANGRIRRGYSSKDASGSYTLWTRGKIGMRLDNIEENVFAKINPEITGMAPVPKGPDGLRIGDLNSRMMGLFSEIEDPAVRDAAWEYILFYDSIEARRIKTAIMVEGGLGPFINPQYLRMFGYPEIERLAPEGWADTFEAALKSARPEPYGRNSNIAYEMLTRPINKAEQLALNEELPVDDAERLSLLKSILDDACSKANEKMMGIVSHGERLKRRIFATLLLLAVVTGFIFLIRRVSADFNAAGHNTMPGRRKRHFWTVTLLAPALISILLWRYVPLFRGSVMAFFDYRLIGDSKWVGLDNFGDLLFDNEWWKAIWNSIRYSLAVISLTFLPPIILAIFLQEIPKGKILFRTIFYLPAVITGLVTILLWKQFYETSDTGVLNAVVLKIPAAGFIAAGLVLLIICAAIARRMLIHNMVLPFLLTVFTGLILFVTFYNLAHPILFPYGFSFGELAKAAGRLFDKTPEAYRWLGDHDTAMLACVMPMVWAGMGPGCLIYLAALKGIPDDFYEAAEIDGAGFIDKILFIVFPSLKALIIINFIGVFINSWYGATAGILAMTGGSHGTEVAGLHIWYKAFTFLRFGPATAAAWMLAFMLIGFTVQQLRILSKVEFKSAGRMK